MTVRGLRRAALVGALAVLALAAAGASASSARPASVTVGSVPALSAGARALGALPARARLRLTVVLKPSDPAGLAAFAKAVSTPGSASFHRYLSVKQFAARYGAPASAVADVRAVMRSAGLTPGVLAPDGLSIAVSASAAAASRAFHVSLRRYREEAGREVYANTHAPRLPAALSGAVEGVLGLDDLQTAIPEGIVQERAGTIAHAAANEFPAGGGPQPCSQAVSTADAAPSGSSYYTINQVAGAYGLDGLYAQGDFGAGVTVALFELEGYTDEASDISSYEGCFGLPSVQPTYIQVDGGPPPAVYSGPGKNASAETSVDIENILGVAPEASVDVYQAPNTATGQYEALSAIVNEDDAQVINDSWGVCEPSLKAGDAAGQAQEEYYLLLQAASQGQSFIVSSGDRGSDGCDTTWNDLDNSDPSPTGLAVDDPASQPYATAVGGTTLSSLGPPPSETAWNDVFVGASGGGISTLWPMPSYQTYSGAPGVINSYTSGAPCGATSGYCREVPDVSADGSTVTGYVIYFNGRFEAVGGTSTAAPLWAGLIALADSSGSPGCTPKAPLGFLNPLLYEIAAGGAHADAFNDVTVGDNNKSFVGNNAPSGPYPATPGYDMTSGLGTPIATDGSSPGLVAQLCAANNTPLGPPPTVSGLSSADAAPGTAITVNGSNFTPYTAVYFGSNEATAVTLESPTQLSAVVPPGSGSVDVTVAKLSGWSATSPADLFTYAPTESIASPVSGATYTQGQSLPASYSCAASTAAPPSCSAPVPSGADVDTSSLGAHQFAVTATDANGVSTTTTASYTVIAPPTITIGGPKPGAVYAQGQLLTAQFSCSSTAAVTITSCSAPVSNGAPIDTATTGTHSFTVAATDSNGVTRTTTVSYTVVTPPRAAVKTPAAGALFLRNQKVDARFACGAAAPARIVSCSATAAKGARINTATLGAHRFTLTATDSNGVSSKLTVTYTVVAVRPKISGLTQTAVRWIESSGSGARLPVGTRFSFALDQPASVTLRFARSTDGRISAGRCVAATLATPAAPSCTRSLAAGSLTLEARPGANVLRFSGKTSFGRLPAGSYTVVLAATGLSGRPSPPVSLHFTIAPNP